MKKTPLLLCLVCFYSPVIFGQKLKRADSFLGFSFDFHAVSTDTFIGIRFRPGTIDTFLDMTHPDFIQVDTKGHPGWSSYPTAVGKQAPQIRKDILSIWREVTEKHHVALFAHYSGLLDINAATSHTNWSVVHADGKPDDGVNSTFGPYADQLLIPQLKELATKYNLDGAWIDGDSWAIPPDYSNAAERAFSKSTGITTIPKQPSDPNFFEYINFNRQQYLKYMLSVVDALHTVKPGFQVCFNWAFSQDMPYNADVPVDFLSGDVTGGALVYTAAFEARCLALRGKPWDLMNWGIARNRSVKPMVQIGQELAEVLAMGGATETYWPQYHDGELESSWFKAMADIAHFCRDRQPYCFRGKIVPQIGLIYSSYAWERVPMPNLFTALGSSGLTLLLNYMLLDRQRPAEILMSYQVKDLVKKYPLIIYPQWNMIDPGIKQELMEYVRSGGNLFVIGANVSAQFSADANVNVEGPSARMVLIAGFEGGKYTCNSQVQKVIVNDSRVERYGTILGANGEPLVTVTQVGSGKLAVAYFDAAAFYTESPVISGLMEQVMNELYSQPLVTIKNADHIHLVISRKDGHLMVHLINTNGALTDPKVMTYDNVPPIGPFEVDIRCDRPHAVMLQPGNQRLDFQYANGVASIRVPSIDIYSIIQLD